MSHAVLQPSTRVARRATARRSAAVAVGIGCLVIGLAGLAGPVAAGNVDEGMLRATDVGLEVASEPHQSTVIGIDLVDPDTCEPQEAVEREARVVSFAQNPKDPASGARLNQVIHDFSSAKAAKAFFADLRPNEKQRAACGTTEKASGVAMTNGPKGVGDERLTVKSKEKIAGATYPVTVVALREGSHVTDLIFINWDGGLDSTTKIAKKAVARLA